MGEIKVNTNSDHCKRETGVVWSEILGPKTIDPTFLFLHLYASSLEITKLFYTQVLGAGSQEMKDGKVWSDDITSSPDPAWDHTAPGLTSIFTPCATIDSRTCCLRCERNRMKGKDLELGRKLRELQLSV